MTRPSWHSRGYLPHCDEDGLVQHVVFRLADSLPKDVLRKLELLSETQRFAKFEALLDAGSGEAVLTSPAAANLVVDAFLYFDDERYALIAWCVMPNHVHVVIEPRGDHALAEIVKSWKAFTARQINIVEGRTGRLWAPDYFDRFMRSDAHLETTIAYVEENPVKAKLCERPEDWPFSSAALRRS